MSGERSVIAPRLERLPATVHLSRRGLMLEDGISYDEWKQAGSALDEMHDLTAWALGDWRLHGIFEGFYTHPDAAQLTLLPESTLRMYEQASGAFLHDRRREGLNIHHHAAVLRTYEGKDQRPTTDDEQDSQLDFAETSSCWPTDLRDRTLGERAGGPVEYVKVTININRESHDKFEQAATRLGMSVADWLFMCGAAEADSVIE